MPATSKLSHNHADTRTGGGHRSPTTSCLRRAPSKQPSKSCCVCKLRPRVRQRRLQRTMATTQEQSGVESLQLPNVCPARATTCCPTCCRCRCRPRSVSCAHAAAAGPAGRDANLCHALCDGGQHHWRSWWWLQLPRAARLRKKMAGNWPGGGVIRARGCVLTHRRQRRC